MNSSEQVWIKSPIIVKVCRVHKKFWRRREWLDLPDDFLAELEILGEVKIIHQECKDCIELAQRGMDVCAW